MTTTQLSPDQHERAREFEALILQQLASVGQRTVANALGVHESTVSRMKAGEIEAICRMLAALELQIVPDSHVVTCPQYLQAVETLAALGLKHESQKA